MKKIVNVLFALFVMCTMLAAQTQSVAVGKKFAVERHALEKSEKDFLYSIAIDFPVAGNPATVGIIREWIAEVQGYCYDGDENDIHELMSYEYQKEREGWSPEFKCETFLKVLKEYETGNYVTYTRYEEGYGGGVHGYTSKYGATFRLSDGRRFGWDMFYSTRKLNAIIFDALKEQYFKVKTDAEVSELIDRFTREGNRQLPLPKTEPWITDKGVVFYYQEYEIGAYCIGAPSCVVPFEKVQEFMYIAARKLIAR